MLVKLLSTITGSSVGVHPHLQRVIAEQKQKHAHDNVDETVTPWTQCHRQFNQCSPSSTNSLSARILHRAPPPPRLQVDQNFLTQKIVADPKMRCHQKSFGIWRVTEAILGQKTCFFSKKHILEKNHNKSHYF